MMMMMMMIMLMLLTTTTTMIKRRKRMRMPHGWPKHVGGQCVHNYFQNTCVRLVDTIIVHKYKLNTTYLWRQCFLRGDVGKQTAFSAMEIRMNFTGKPRKLKQCNYTGSIHVSFLRVLHEERTINHSISCRGTRRKCGVSVSLQPYSNSETRCHHHTRFRQPEMPDVLLI
jgi:hypothetical protein